jgi:hypothetical protein
VLTADGNVRRADPACCTSTTENLDRGDGCSLARSRSERWTSCQCTRAHAEARAQWRRNVTQHVAAARAPAVVTDGAGGIGAQPVAAHVAGRIDALHRETGQILHKFPPRLPVRSRSRAAQRSGPLPTKKVKDGAKCAARRLECQEKTPQYVVVSFPNRRIRALTDSRRCAPETSATSSPDGR